MPVITIKLLEGRTDEQIKDAINYYLNNDYRDYAGEITGKVKKADVKEDTTKDGFGLGLAMVKEFCDKNKISINIDTTELGNQFNLNLKNIIK